MPPPPAARSFNWSNNNVRQVLDFTDDDRIRFADQPGEARFSFSMQIPEALVQQAITEFGVAEPDLSFSYAAGAMEQAMAAHARRLATRGLRLAQGVVQPDYEWIVHRSRTHLAPVAQKLVRMAAEQGLHSQRDLAGVFASFCQSAIAYSLVPNSRSLGGSGAWFTGGITMPIEALATGRGDCDTKCALFASLASHVPSLEVLLLGVPEHMFAAVAVEPKSRDALILHGGRQFVAVELTSSFPLGLIPRNSRSTVSAGASAVLYDSARRLGSGTARP
jgi:hypothetical protein